MRILMSAFACDPTRGSERGVGWSWAVAAAERHEVVLMTGEWNRDLIEKHRSDTEIADVIYVDVPEVRLGWLGCVPTFGHYYVYLRWQQAAAEAVQRLHDVQPFDLLHHITYGACWLPSYLYKIPAPLVLGPVGGAERCPATLLASLPLRGLIREGVRVATQALLTRFAGTHHAIIGAALCIGKTEESCTLLRRHGAHQVILGSELSIPESLSNSECWDSSEHPPMPICLAVTRLEYWKGVHLTIRAFGELVSRHPGARLRIIGDGPDRPRLERLRRRLRLDASVEFLPHVSRVEVFKNMRDASIFVHPTLHDSSGNVLVEAMASGLPIICLDIGGPSAVVARDAGILVQPGSQRTTIARLAEAMLLLAGDAGERARLAERGREHATDTYGSTAFRQRIDEIYRVAVAGRSSGKLRHTP